MKLLHVNNTKLYYTPTTYKFNFQIELARYNFINMLADKYENARAIIYWSLMLSNDNTDPFITLANKQVFKIINMSTDILEEWNEHIEKFIGNPDRYFNNNCTIDDIKISYKNNICYLTCNSFNKKYILLRKKYNDKSKAKIFSAFLRYDALGFITPISAAVKPQIYQYLHNNYDSEVELFGSFFNTNLKYYFGLFYDLEKDFGCLGNYFKAKLESGFYVCNPPYVLQIMNMFFYKIKKELEGNNNINIYMTLPAWYNNDRKLLNKKCNSKVNKKLRTDYDENYKIDILKKFTVLNHLFCKSDYSFHDYTKNKNINLAPVNVVVLSNNDLGFNFKKIHDKYIENKN